MGVFSQLADAGCDAYTYPSLQVVDLSGNPLGDCAATYQLPNSDQSVSISVPSAIVRCLAEAPAAAPDLPTSCGSFPEFSTFSSMVNAACCSDGVECPPGGIPTSCTEACAAILIPMQQTCAGAHAILISTLPTTEDGH